MVVNVVSVRVGQKYGPEYAEILHDMAGRNLSTVEQRHWCLTDDPDSVPEGVTPIPAKSDLPGWWQKPYLFSADMPWAEGDRILYLDLDVCVTGRLEDLTQTPGIMKDAAWPCYNSSVMVWDHGEHREVWDRFDPAMITQPGHIVPISCLPKGEVNGGDQEWLTEVGGWRLLNREWCVSYKFGGCEAWPPTESKVVVFHGEPKPDQITGTWVEKTWRVGGYTSLPRMTGLNVDRSVVFDNVRANLKRDIPWFVGYPKQTKPIVIVGGAPSMKNHLLDIKAHRRNGARIVTVNNALGYLLSRGIKPHAHIMLDARPENAEFVKDAPEGVKYFLASQCHPDVFDALKDRDVIMWHNAAGDGEELAALLKEELPGRRAMLVPGGCTVGLRAIMLSAGSGYRTIHAYGMDSSYSGTEHHAYDQTLNDGEQTLEIMMGDKSYRCARWMVRQAEDFRNDYTLLSRQGVKIFVHGTGLIPDIARQMRTMAVAA